MILFLSTRRLIPDVDTIPDLSTPRSLLDKDSPQAAGITPFMLTSRDVGRSEMPSGMTTASGGGVTAAWSETRLKPEMRDPRLSVGSPLSAISHESTQLLHPPR